MTDTEVERACGILVDKACAVVAKKAGGLVVQRVGSIMAEKTVKTPHCETQTLEERV